MLGEGAHVLHDQFRLTKHPRVDALQNKVLFCCAIQGYQEGVMDIAISIFPDVQDPAPGFELVGNGDKMVQGLVCDAAACCHTCSAGPFGLLCLSLNRCVTTKNTGTKGMARSVEESMPPKTTVPRARRLAAPAPEAPSSGTTPMMKAKEVMMMGRNRRRVASTAASVMDRPPGAQLPGELHDQDGVLAGQGDHQDQAHLGVEVVVIAPGDERQEHPHQGHGHGEDDRRGTGPALVEGGQHQVDQGDGQGVDEIRLIAHLLLPGRRLPSSHKPCRAGGCCLATCSICLRAWPELNPGAAAPKMAAAGYRL